MIGLEVKLSQNIAILVIFTIISIARNYVLRSIFSKAKKKVKKDLKENI